MLRLALKFILPVGSLSAWLYLVGCLVGLVWLGLVWFGVTASVGLFEVITLSLRFQAWLLFLLRPTRTINVRISVSRGAASFGALFTATNQVEEHRSWELGQALFLLKIL